MTPTARTARYASFAALALVVNLLVFRFHSSAFGAANQQDLIRAGLFFDCVITIPLCYWLLLVRPGLRGRMSLALIAAVSLLRGAYLLPSRAGLMVGLAVEAALVILIATRVKRIEEVLPSKTMARIVRAEIDVYRFAFGRTQPFAPTPGAHAFTIHESSGAATLFWLLACLTPIEAGAVHFLLPVKLAWIFSAVSVYGAVWMVAVARSLSRLPIIVDAQGVTLRKGMLASMYVPRDAIASVSRQQPSEGYARFAVLADATVWITFNCPLTVELPLGFTRKVQGAAVAPDDAAGFFNSI